MPREFDLGGAVPPWGRSAAEYEAFFALSDIPPAARILDCGAGPSSFAAEWNRNGRFVVATDPTYRLSSKDIAADFETTAARMLEGMRKAHGRFKWDRYGSPEGVVQLRREVLTAFIADFQSSTQERRYAAARLPELPFKTSSFDFVLCSHLLFLYSGELDTEMHVASLREMLRVGKEVRVFPLLDMDGEPSAHLEASIQALRASARVELAPVPFEFRYGDSRMLRLTQLDSIEFRLDDLSGEPTRQLIERHLRGMRATSPPESIHALDIDKLRHSSVTFWSAWVKDEIAGCGALQRLDSSRCEIKSMRVADGFLGRGIGRAILQHLLAESRRMGFDSVWLETGSTDAFIPAIKLYESAGFVRCGPFGDYVLDPFSIFMTLKF